LSEIHVEALERLQQKEHGKLHNWMPNAFSVFVLNKKTQNKPYIPKEKRKKFMRAKSPFKDTILNKYGYVFTWICFEDSLRLFIVAYIE